MLSLSFLIFAMVVMVILLSGGLWISFAIGIGGFISLYPVLREASIIIFGVMSWNSGTDFILLALPLFIFMGDFIATTGLVNSLYTGTTKVIAGLPGGLVQTNLFACTIFAACSGSSVASAATMGRVAYPEQVLRRGYDPRLVLGSIAGGGTLGILIPPSIFFIIYGTMADQSIGRLFLGGVFPGLLISFMFMLYVGIRCLLQPHLIPKGLDPETMSWMIRLSGLREIWPFLMLIISVMGSLYGGIATPTEAAGVGGAAAILIAIFYRVFSWKALIQASLNTVKTTSMVFMILISAKVLSVSLGFYGVPAMMRDFAQSFAHPLVLLTIISVTYLILGMIFEDFSLMLLLIPFVVPLIGGMGFDMVWFGVYLCILLEAGLLSPPVGLNLFVIQNVTGAPLNQVAWGSIPFFVILLLGAVMIALGPQIVLWLPRVVLD